MKSGTELIPPDEIATAAAAAAGSGALAHLYPRLLLLQLSYRSWIDLHR